MATIPVATAMAYLAAGLSCLPAAKARKHPAIGSWKNWQTRLPTEVEVRAWFSNAHDAICVVSGAVSGNLECLDFDNGGELFAAWIEKVDTGLLAQLVIEQTPSGGYHVCYRCDDPVDGNLKLARGIRDGKQKTLIETRGEGGLFLCAPTEGYSLQQGDFANLPTISPDARQALLDAARSLDELPAASCPTAPVGANVGQRGVDSAPTGGKDAFDLAPGDDFNARGDIHPLLEAAGWQFCGNNPDGNELWTRPGKDPRNGISATYKDGSFYVFSSNAAPFEPNVMYSPFAVYATLNHNGDYTAAASALLTQGYGKAKSDLGGVTLNLKPVAAAGTTQAEEGPIPLGTLKKRFPEMRPVLIDGFLRIGETMNIIAAPKTGKSWLVTQLCVCVASGTDWFGHVCTPGRVLIIDNELHEETSANRIPLVVEAMRRANPSLPNVDDMIDVWNLRGKWKSIADLSAWLPRFKEAGYRMIVIDAFYRALPKDTDENDNGSIASIYNLIDTFAKQVGCSFVLIHHTSKGNQSQKSITDVGAGAGSQSRAADTHLILREHKDDGFLVLEAVVRSFPRQEPIVLQKAFPLMLPDYERNPDDLAGKSEVGVKKDDPPPSEIAKRLAELVEPDHPQAKGVFIDTVKTAYGLMEKTAKLAVERAITDGLIVCGRLPNQPKGMQATKFITLPGEEDGDDRN
ncbi:MAG: AAA family ATPase [Kiritimatiellae bacterium]|nr:AAA family ATPase [Kiritimatiellia bacterium]MBR0196594.1 AAA family ATPase [Kiritimatiellia bacterium]